MSAVAKGGGGGIGRDCLECAFGLANLGDVAALLNGSMRQSMDLLLSRIALRFSTLSPPISSSKSYTVPASLL